jgi:hypothetical protein
MQLPLSPSNVTNILAVAYILHAHRSLRATKQVIDECRFGRPLQIVATSGQQFPTHRPPCRDACDCDRVNGGGAGHSFGLDEI